MSIGERRFRVTFQRATISQDSYGEPDKVWGDMCTSWGLIKPLKGAERLSANQLQSDVTHRIVVRYRSELSDLDAGDRVTWTSAATSPETTTTFDITSVIWRDHMIKEIEILAKVHGNG